ncbi:MAG: 4a-hydroxytetrahydrobiopterin dehydratase [Opitutia bacterium]|nr:4a-hydroxytetrahydrobiopterin dehydratase [Opitutales bacterium]PHX68830.1 MAG: 4a-hydroxytetrahydrobiopterin dehydratase [Opitutae bacterium]
MNRMSTPLDLDQIKLALSSLTHWRFEDDKLLMDIKLKNFSEALSLLVKVGIEAEKLNHHPEIYNIYNKVTLKLTTHDAGNKVTQKDIVLARAIENLVL